MQEKITSYYNQKISILESEIQQIKKNLTFVYAMRVLAFFIFGGFIILFFSYNYNLIFAGISILGLVMFIFAIKYDLQFDFKHKFLTNKLVLNQNELKSLNHQYSECETGEEFANFNPHLSADFDVFGEGSLFQYLNRCCTKNGKLKFSQGLSKSEFDKKIIIEKQQAIKELSEKNEFVQNFRANGMFVNETGSEFESLKQWLNEPSEKLTLFKILCFIIPATSLIWICLMIFGVFSINSFTLPTLISLLISFNFVKIINKAHSKLSNSAKTFEKYTVLIKLIENEEFNTKYLLDLKQKLQNNEHKASESLTTLFKLMNTFDLRLNIIVSFVLNSLILFDIQIYWKLEKWKSKNKIIVSSWFSALYDLDSLTSFSTYAFNNEAFVTYPIIAETEFSLQAKNLGHPLLNHQSRICNDIDFSDKPFVMIITGANMAGKSTFLRTISINLILAMNGAPVCAENFSFTPCDIMSSINIKDSLSNNESYFYAELVRIKEIIEHTNKQPKSIVILDEILRGTNTKDKQQGSLGLLENLIKQRAVVLIATHDLVIGELENKYPKIVINRCFEVELTNDRLIFDYKLKKGISQKLNASFLMKKMGIIE